MEDAIIQDVDKIYNNYKMVKYQQMIILQNKPCSKEKKIRNIFSIVIFNLLIVKSLENHAEIYLLILVLTQKLRVMTRICFIILEIK